MATTAFKGPLVIGPRKDQSSQGNINVGDVVLTQYATITTAMTTATLLPINLPKNAIVLEATLSGNLAGTSATVSVGTTATSNEIINAQTYSGAAYVPNPTAGSQLTGGFAKLAADTQLYGKVGGTSLTGSVTVAVQYIMPGGYNSSGVTSTAVASPNYPI